MMYDFDREYQMALTNQAFAPDVETVCLFTSLNNSFLSSSKVKEIVMAGGSVAGMVPAHVLSALERKYKQVSS
jgi:pantetheine-phosphate adenylyltransferase